MIHLSRLFWYFGPLTCYAGPGSYACGFFRVLVERLLVSAAKKEEKEKREKREKEKREGKEEERGREGSCLPL